MADRGRALLGEFPPTTTGPLATGIPFVERCQIEILHNSRGRAVLRVPFDPNINHVGMVYAGALFTVAEVPGGTLFTRAFDNKKYYPVVGNVEIRYLRPAMSAVTVDARMNEEEIERVTNELSDSGKSKYVLEMELFDSEGNAVAFVTGTYFGLAF